MVVSAQVPQGEGPGRRWGPMARIRNHMAFMNPKQIQFSIIEFLYWMAASAASFTVVFLQDKGMSSSQVGIVMAMLNVFGIISPPFWGMVSDKVRSVKKVLVLCLIVGSLIFALVPAAANYFIGPWMLVVLVLPISAFFRTPTTSLLDSWTIKTVNRERGMAYGSIRLWGSIGYAIMAFLFGVLIKRLGGATITFYMYGLLNIPMILMCFFQKGDEVADKQKVSFRELHAGRLLKNYYLVVFLIFNTMLYLPVQGTFTFLPYLITEISGNSNSLGTIISIKAFMEVPMLLGSAYLVKRFGIVKMIVLGGVLYTCEQFLYVLCGSIWQVTLVMVIHGTAFGIYLACSVSYIYHLAPKELSATAQTICGALSSLSGIMGNLFGGYIVEMSGIRSYYGIAGAIQIVSLLLFLVSFPLGKRLTGQMLPQSVLAQRQ